MEQSERADPSSPVLPHTSLIKIPYQGTSMRISNNKKYIVFGTRSGFVVSFNKATQKIEKSVQVSESSLWNLYISNSDSFVLAGGVDSEIKYLSFPDLIVKAPLLGHTREINHVFISRSELVAYSASDDGTVRVWDLQNRTNLILYTQNNLVYALDLSLDEKFLASGASNGSINLYNATHREIVWKSSTPNSSGVWCIKISNQQNYIVVGDSSGNLSIWTFHGDLIRFIQDRHRDRLRCLDFSPDEEFFISSGNDHLIKVWEVKSWREELTFDFHTNWVKAVVIDLEKRTVTSIGDDQQIAVTKIPEFNTNYYMPDVFIWKKPVYVKDTNCFYIVNDGILHVCDIVALEIISEVPLPCKNLEMKGIIGKSKHIIGILFENIIMTVNALTYEVQIKEFTGILKAYMFEQFSIVCYDESFTLLRSNNFGIIRNFFGWAIDYVDIIGSRIFFSSQQSLYEANTEEIIWERKWSHTICCLKIITPCKLLVFDQSTTLSIMSLLSKEVIFTMQSENVPFEVYSDDTHFFLASYKIVEVYSNATFELTSVITSSDNLASMTLFKVDTVLCSYRNQANLVKFQESDPNTGGITWKKYVSPRK